MAASEAPRFRLGVSILPPLAAGLLLFLAAGGSPAADVPAGSAPAAADNAAVPTFPAADNAAVPTFPAADNAAVPAFPAADNGWVDRTHARIEREMFDTVVWFDRFFGDERMLVTEQPKSFLRWMNDLRWDEEEGFTFRTTARASLRLPRLNKRWRIVISGETRGDPNAVTPEDPGNPGLVTGSRVRTGSTELIYELLRTPRSTLDVGTGVRVKIPPDAFVRTRFQYVRPLSLNTLGRFTATAFWDAQDGFGESNQLDLEYRLAPPTLLRWSNSLEITQESDGWTWGTDLTLLHKLSPKSAITFAAGASVSTRPAWIAQDYRILARYRRNVWRKWLFLEGEPDIHWPRKENESRKTVWGATLRAEILFTGRESDPRVGGWSGP